MCLTVSICISHLLQVIAKHAEIQKKSDASRIKVMIEVVSEEKNSRVEDSSK
jgi:hypothetical protein